MESFYGYTAAQLPDNREMYDRISEDVALTNSRAAELVKYVFGTEQALDAEIERRLDQGAGANRPQAIQFLTAFHKEEISDGRLYGQTHPDYDDGSGAYPRPEFLA